MDCATFKELVGLMALGALDGEERALAQAHLAQANHEGCLEALAAAMEGASVLDGDGPVEPPSANVWTSIARAIAPGAARLRRTRRSAAVGWSLAAVAASLVIWLGVRPPGRDALVAALDAARQDTELRTAALSAETIERDACRKRLLEFEHDDKARGEAVALLQLAGTQLFPLRAEKGQAATANAILHTGKKRAYVVAEGLLPISDHDYELWVARGKKVVAAGVIHVDAEGRTVARADYEELLGTPGAPDAMMITLEPAGGGDTVRGPTIVIGTVHS